MILTLFLLDKFSHIILKFLILHIYKEVTECQAQYTQYCLEQMIKKYSIFDE